MSNPGRRLLVLILCALSANGVAGESLALITAPGQSRAAPSRVELAQIFRSKVDVDDDGERIVPVNLPVGHPARELFSVAVLGRSPQQLQTFWNEQYFHGKKPPIVLDSQEAVIRFVANTPGAIGYVFYCVVDSRVQVVDRISIGTAAAVDQECARGSSRAD